MTNDPNFKKINDLGCKRMSTWKPNRIYVPHSVIHYLCLQIYLYKTNRHDVNFHGVGFIVLPMYKKKYYLIIYLGTIEIEWQLTWRSRCSDPQEFPRRDTLWTSLLHLLHNVGPFFSPSTFNFTLLLLSLLPF